MPFKSLIEKAEYRRYKVQAGWGCYFYVRGVRFTDPSISINSAIQDYLTKWEINEDIVSLKWLESEYYRYQDLDLKG